MLGAARLDFDLTLLHPDSRGSDQYVRMRRPICIFAGRICHVWSCYDAAKMILPLHSMKKRNLQNVLMKGQINFLHNVYTDAMYRQLSVSSYGKYQLYCVSSDRSRTNLTEND